MYNVINIVTLLFIIILIVELTWLQNYKLNITIINIIKINIMFTVSLNHFLFANVMANILVMAQLQIKWNVTKKLNKLKWIQQGLSWWSNG